MSNFYFALVFIVAELTAYSSAFKCPESNGIYEHPTQCDKYYECVEGQVTERLCDDGLVFDLYSPMIVPCDHQFKVDCSKRPELQPPSPSGSCPRKNGFYAHPDPSVCNLFFTCTNGLGVQMTCPSGLHFDTSKGTCVWPASARREGCGNKEELKDGFGCVNEEVFDKNGQKIIHPRYPHPDDCQKFYVCLNGISPREQGCQLGQVFSLDKDTCVYPEEEPGCEDWYKDHPELEQINRDRELEQKRIDRQKNRPERRQRKQKKEETTA